MERPDPALYDRRDAPLPSALIGDSRAIAAARSLIARAGPSDAPVLLTGPTGSGKEVAARALHAASSRAAGPFVAVNCAAVPRDLLESEFFGHERGAFTGASARQAGLFELAAGGTLFLDEIGDMPLDLQAKLLRVLEDGLVRRLGAEQPVATDFRIVAASNQPLDELVAARAFRADLFYRLDVIAIELPPLAARAEDIRALVSHFAADFDPEGTLTFTEAAMAVLRGRAWPGNVRQLRNFVQRAAVLAADRRIDAADALALLDRRPPAPSPPKAEPLDLRRIVASTEIEVIEEALRSADYVVAAAARALGVSRTSLIEKVRKHRIALREELADFLDR